MHSHGWKVAGGRRGAEKDFAQHVVCPSTHADEHRPLKSVIYSEFNPNGFGQISEITGL